MKRLVFMIMFANIQFKFAIDTFIWAHLSYCEPGFCVNKKILWMSNIDFYLFRVLDRLRVVSGLVLLPNRASRILLLHTIVILRSLSNLTGISTLGLANNFQSPLHTNCGGGLFLSATWQRPWRGRAYQFVWWELKKPGENMSLKSTILIINTIIAQFPV